MLPALAAQLHTFLKSSFMIMLHKDLATSPQWFQPLDTTVILSQCWHHSETKSRRTKPARSQAVKIKREGGRGALLQNHCEFSAVLNPAKSDTC